MTQILIADDSQSIREVVAYALEDAGFDVASVSDGVGVLRWLACSNADLLILDVLMPELDGLSVCRELRRHSNLPIIFLSSRAEEADRVGGLELGGDDYVTKPFSPRELVSRVRAVLRRGQEEVEGAVYRHQDMTLDVSAHEVHVAEQRVDLTTTEFRVLQAMMEKQGRAFSRAQLIRIAYDGAHHVSERTVDTHVRRIRAKLRVYGSDPIETLHGLGYKIR